jgi:hypothetical protein
MLVGLFTVWPLPKAKDFGDGAVAAETPQIHLTGQLDRTESLTCDIPLVKQSRDFDLHDNRVSRVTEEWAVAFLDAPLHEFI